MTPDPQKTEIEQLLREIYAEVTALIDDLRQAQRDRDEAVRELEEVLHQVPSLRDGTES